MSLQVCICGGGNSAHTAAGYISSKTDIRVNVFTRKPELWSKQIKVTTATSSWAHKGTFQGNLNLISNDPAAVAKGTNVFLVAAPANAHPDLLKAIAPYVEKGAWVGTVYAQGGFDWAVKWAFGSNFSNISVVFGLLNIPWICKTTTQGKEARILGPKQDLFVATYPTSKGADACNLMFRLFDIPCSTIPNFLCLTLTPSNQIIHPARYYGIFRDWDGKKGYTLEELKKREGMTLYEDMDEFSAEWLAILDNELQQIKLAILQRYPQVDLSSVLPIGPRIVKQYGKDVKDTSSLRKIFQTNLGYVGCGTPLQQAKGSQTLYQPALASRLFWEDIPYGLCILKDLAELLGNFPTPGIDQMILWHQQFMGVKFLIDGKKSPAGTSLGLYQLNRDPSVLKTTGTASKYGFKSIDDVVSTSLPSPKSKL